MGQSAPTPCVCTTVRKTARVLARAYDDALEPARLNVTQLAVMRGIGRHEGQALVRLAEDLEMERTTLYRALTLLEHRGLVSITQGPEGRSRSVATSERGKKLLKDAAPTWDQLQLAIVGRFGRRAWANLVKELARLQDCIP